MKTLAKLAIIFVISIIISHFAGITVLESLALSSSPIYIERCARITESGYYKLARDIYGTLQYACIIIDSDNVVLDGNGYSVIGPGFDTGIVIKNLKENVTIRNIKIEGYKNGISFQEGSQYIKITKIKIVSRDLGIGAKSSSNIVVEDSVISSNNVGILVEESYFVNISRSEIKSIERGIHIDSSFNIVVRNNIIKSNGYGVYAYGLLNMVVDSNNIQSADIGVELAKSSDALVRGNNIFGGDKAIRIHNSQKVKVTENSISLSKEGIHVLYSLDIDVDKNSISCFSLGVKLEGSNSIKILDNEIIGARGSKGVYLLYSTGVAVAGNKIIDHETGLCIRSVSNVYVYNNLFNNSNNLYLYDIYDIKAAFWNTTLQKGANIVGGDWIGGNAWFTLDGEGYSKKCEDEKEPIGICDEPYVIEEGHVDYLPLSFGTAKSRLISTQTPMLTPTPTPTTPTLSPTPATPQIWTPTSTSTPLAVTSPTQTPITASPSAVAMPMWILLAGIAITAIILIITIIAMVKKKH